MNFLVSFCRSSNCKEVHSKYLGAARTIFWVSVVLTPLIVAITLILAVALFIPGIYKLCKYDINEAKHLWATLLQLVFIPYRAHGAFRSAISGYEKGKERIIKIKEKDDTTGQLLEFFQKSHFQKFMTKILQTVQCLMCPSSPEKLPSKNLPHVSGWLITIPMVAKEARSIGIIIPENTVTTEEEEIEIQVCFFAGSETQWEVLNCFVDLADGVPPIFHEVEKCFQAVRKKIEDHNKNKQEKSKQVLVLAGHSMGGLFANALCMKYGNISCYGYDALGIGLGVLHDFVSNAQGNNAQEDKQDSRKKNGFPPSILNMHTKGDHVADPEVSCIYRTLINRVCLPGNSNISNPHMQFCEVFLKFFKKSSADTKSP
ncbi:MAG: hypothetical protein LBG86_02265 [Puniceicoccales bacterium]|nr:hypothetical protein [Puniceicoccales bacterium]